jgi:hypothetical protein
VAGLWGCAFTQVSTPQPTTPAVAPPSSPAAPLLLPTQPAPPAQPAPPVSPPVQPTYTPLPTYTPYPTQVPDPTYTPLPSYTPQVVQPVYYPSPTPYVVSNQPAGKCCTLRVRNHSSHTLWIGTYLPYGGNAIDPLWYVEFYPSQPGPLRVYWCRYTPYSDYHYDCLHSDFYVEEGFNEVGVP